MTRHLNSLADLGSQLDSLGFGPSYLKNVRGAFGKAPKHYGDALSRVPADLAEFDRRWGRGRVRRHPPSFRSADEFKTWRKLIRSALTRGLDVRPGSVIAGDWAILAAFVRDSQGRGKLFGWNAHLTFEALARAASRVGLAPGALDQRGVDMLVIDLGTSERKSVHRGIARLNNLIAARETLPTDIRQCLPPEILPEPTPLVRHTSPWARSSKNPIGTAIWAEFDRIMQIKRYGAEGPVIVGTPSAFSENSVTGYQNAVSWLLGALWQLDLLDSGSGLKDALTHANMIAATNAWISRRQQRGLPTDTSSLHAWISKLTHLAIDYLDVPPGEVKRMRELRKKPAIRTKSVGQMSRVRLKWIMEFDRDVAMQRRIERLPETLMGLAEKILKRQRAGSRTSPTEAMRALKLGVAATQTAILFRASPIRSGNLRHLRFRGAGAEFPLDALNDCKGALRLMISGEQVKNGEDIDEIADDDLAPILRWYLAEIRPRLIADHPFSKNYCDSDYLFPSPTERPMEGSNFREMFKASCAQIGLDFDMHQARHITAYWILFVDPRAWGEAAAVLHIDEMTVRKYYGWMSTRRASDAGRQKLLEQRRSFRRNSDGDFNE